MELITAARAMMRLAIVLQSPPKDVSFVVVPFMLAFSMIVTAHDESRTLPIVEVGVTMGAFLSLFEDGKASFCQDFVKVGVWQLCHGTAARSPEADPQLWSVVCLWTKRDARGLAVVAVFKDEISKCCGRPIVTRLDDEASTVVVVGHHDVALVGQLLLQHASHVTYGDSMLRWNP